MPSVGHSAPGGGAERANVARPLQQSAHDATSAGGLPFCNKLTWLALGDDQADPSRGGEQATALGRL